MGADEMTNRIAEGSPRFKARMAGACQLLEAITATFGQVIVLNKLVVSGNAAATAANILGHERLFWLGFASSLLGVAFHIAWALLMYVLLKPVNRSLSLLAAFFSLVACAMQALTSLLYLAPLLILPIPARLPNFETPFPAWSSGCCCGDQGVGLGALSVPATRKLSVALHR